MKFNHPKTLYSLCAAMFIITAFDVFEAQTNRRLDAAAVKYAKSYRVSMIEKGFPPKPFAVWFQELVGAKTPVSWETNDCGEQTGDAESDKARDFPMCVNAIAEQSAYCFVSVNIQYGTFKRGITRGKPVIRYISVGPQGEGEYIESLADLQKRLIKVPQDDDVFDPNGGEFVLDSENRPPGLEDLRDIYLATKDTNERGKSVSVKPTGGLETWKPQVFEMRNIFFDGKRWRFETTETGGVRYKFDGTFIKPKRYPDGTLNNQGVLEGRLLKFFAGRQAAAAFVIFSFQVADDN